MENILEVKNLCKSYDEFSLKGINFSLEPGYIMGFIGPNGAGKSTTIKAIMNLIKTDAGQIEIFGKDHLKYEKEIKEKIGFVYDENYFYEELTLKEMKKIIAPFYKNWSETIFEKYMKQFNLSLKLKVKELSKGMKMKYSLALALSHDADLIIMDEPTSGLDPIVRSELLDILYEVIQDERKSILFSTHITKDLDKIADYITFINDGKLVFSQAKDEIIESYQIIKGDTSALTENIINHFVGLKQHSFGFEALVKKEIIKKSPLKDSVIYEIPTLEDIMVYTVRGKINV
ncbi:ABC transporter ATP-binding protein [Clostridium formicaceticum]|uniref:ABC transporter ATP-binding protein YtrB n=1 Tax=Clostridium formicaceticum TaxID=1497 RepID=A0AAC9WI92_9CLOT|nr:ABC transporter ATP-binding protein [Clostridium formicaceticum]AOY77924.1 sodium ABC transporter ATP-binding protein [Clostridium formicaceticum]ARE88545.1 ABC transporter ATP-binding protein YtrB [Clostridium formicaceticum]